MATGTLLILAAWTALRWMGEWRRRPPPPAAPPLAALPEGFRWPDFSASVWDVFRSGAPPPPAPAASALAGRYRLAGIFLLLSDPEDTGPEHRCAILDDLQTRQQYLAGEGEEAGDCRVLRVAPDHVVLTDGEREEVLYLTAGAMASPAASTAADASPAAAAPSATVLESNRFGQRVGDTRWEVSRQALLDYYQEVLDRPERLAALFLAMEPDRDEEGRIAGYRLNMNAGEREFYTQVGFQDGDVVRRVNSMRMTSQRRAEYFIGEFIQNRLGAVVIDIERNGQPLKLVYLVK